MFVTASRFLTSVTFTGKASKVTNPIVYNIEALNYGRKKFYGTDPSCESEAVMRLPVWVNTTKLLLL